MKELDIVKIKNETFGTFGKLPSGTRGTIIHKYNNDTFEVEFPGGTILDMDISMLEPITKGLRYNQGKPQWSLVDFDSLEPLVRVLEYGCVKYERDNWKKGLDKTQIMESMMRHLIKLMDGEETDKESGLSHIGHIQANCMFLQYMKTKFNDTDVLSQGKTLQNNQT